jgi:hypothetical protein
MHPEEVINPSQKEHVVAQYNCHNDTLDMIDQELVMRKPDIVIFNSGIHYRQNDVVMGSINKTISALEKWQKNCRSRGRNESATATIWCLPIWRTTVPGHPHCDNYRKPVNNLSIVESQIQNANYSQFNGNHYHWWDMKDQNIQIENAFSQRTMMLDYEVLDAYDAMTRRPDMHQGGKDCIHYCLPGPPDVLSRMLIHTLMRWKTSISIGA